MAARPEPLGLAALAACGLLVSAAPPAHGVRLPYDPGVFLSGACTAPALAGCGDAAPSRPMRASASQALLDAGREPHLAVDLSGLLDMGAQVTGGAAAETPVAP